MEAQGFLQEIYPRLLHWHRYLLTLRDPEKSGLVTIYDPWESGTDNSLRWDAALEAVEADLAIKCATHSRSNGGRKPGR